MSSMLSIGKEEEKVAGGPQTSPLSILKIPPGPFAP